MNLSLLPSLRCPACGLTLELESSTPGVPNGIVVEGALRCTGCATRYPIQNGMPDLMPRDGRAASKAREMAGWVALWKKKGMYERPTLEDSFKLPYLGGMWADVARMFEAALEVMALKGGEVILDVGAGQGWASRHFAAKGCSVIAMDIVADEWYGLGRAWAIMEHAGVAFEPMLADGEALPYPADHFDFVFFCGTLHHFENFDRVLAQMLHVLKPGGRLIATNEPAISIIARERAVQDRLEETHEGIVERRPKVWEYRQSLKRVGFTDIRIDTFDTFRNSATDIYSWIAALRQSVVQAVGLFARPLMWLAFSLVLTLPARWAGRLTLYLMGGNLLIQASKPTLPGARAGFAISLRTD